jgi:hypothetical protein
VASRPLADIFGRLAPEIVKFANEYGRFNEPRRPAKADEKGTRGPSSS